MIHSIKILLVSITIINGAIASAIEQSPNTFLFCLKPELQPLEISLNRGGLSVGMPELDDFFHSHDVVKIEPWIKSATDMDRDGDIYLNRIYRVYLDENGLSRADQSILSIHEFPFILYAEPEYIRKPYYIPNDPKYSNQCSLTAVKADLAWDYWDIPDDMPGDQNVLLASVDTGVDYTHPDLVANLWVNQGEIPALIYEIGVDVNEDGYISSLEIADFMSTQSDLNEDGISNIRDALTYGSPFMDGIDNDGNGYVDDLIGWDASGTSGTPDNDPFPKTGIPNNSTWAHGTHVAGIMAATTDNAVGMASTMFKGKILSVKCSMDGPATDEPGIHDGYNGITYAAKAACPKTQEECQTRTIINCSWGGGGFSSSENSVINNAYNTYGAIVVGAAGNGNEDTGQEEYAAHYPASYDNVISVSAFNCSGTGCLCEWGGWATYHPTVDLAAPGNNVLSTIIGDGYQNWDGSSMASPNAASVMGLVWSYYMDSTNVQIIEKVLQTADPFIYDENPEYLNCNGNEGEYCLGSGLVDAQKALGLPFITVDSYSFNETDGDGDGVINPGETGFLTITLRNAEGGVDAESITATLSSDDPHITIIDEESVFGDILAGTLVENNSDTYQIKISPDIELGGVIFKIQVSGFSASLIYNQTFEYNSINVSFNQRGFPIATTSRIRTSPLIIDLNNDGENEIIFGDYNGYIHIFYLNGTELEDQNFPFDTGNQIWGSAAAADMDGDGLTDFVITSKSKHLYIFDKNGLKTDYNANQFLMGTPAIGNLDDDDDLEVVICSYSSSNQLFVVNPDGSDVNGFPLLLDEKVKAGVALADFDGNGIDDIVFGTDNSNVYLIYDDGNIADGFPFIVGDAIQTAPSILDINGDKVIFVGTGEDSGHGQDNNFYAINADGSLRFKFEANNDIMTSPSFLNHNGNQYIFFGDDDSLIYAIDKNGDILNGWPVHAGAPISKSIIFSDLDCDGEAEIIAVNEGLDIVAYNLDGTLHQGFPINGSSAFTSSAVVVDLDNDGDLEILSGAQNELAIIDVKSTGSDTSYWNMYRGNLRRTGYSGTSPIGGYIAECPEDLAIINNSFPTEFILSPLYPNPFNPVTTISYSLSQAGATSLKAFNLAGKELETLINKKQNPGDYLFMWNASSYPSGIYFIRLESNNFTETRKVLLIK